MKTLWIVLLVCVVAVGAFFLGQRMKSAPEASSPAATDPSAVPGADAAASTDAANDSRPSAQPGRTFRGPDGRPHLITYDPANPPDNKDPVQVKAALLEDMKNHPRNIMGAYDLTEAQIAEILAGTRPFPENLLPPPQAPTR